MKNKMYKIGIVFALAAFVVISYTALSGLGNLNAPYPEDTPVTIRVETDKPSYSLGEIVKIKVYLINHKNETTKIEGSMTIGYEVFSSNGESLIGIRANYFLHPDYPIILPPQGETLFYETFEWNQKYVSIQGSSYTQTEAGPGTYTIKVIISSQFGKVSSGTTIEIRV